MNDVGLAMRWLVYAHFGRTGRAPSRVDLAEQLDEPVAWVDGQLASLADEHALVLGADGEIAKALPFCAEPTEFVVRAADTTYYGNCAWDARALGAAWFGSYLDADWRPRTRDESQAILDRLGLRGPFWRLPPE